VTADPHGPGPDRSGRPAGPGRLYGVGVGPGDPELVTVKARRVIGEVDVVAYPTARHGRSLARSIAEPYIATGVIELAMTYPVTTEETDHPGGYEAALSDFYDRCACELAGHLDAGRSVAVLCEGDPFFYGSFMYLHDRLAGDYATEVVPGVTSPSAAAAATGTPLARRDEVLTILPGTLPTDELAARLAGTDAAVVLKLGRTLPSVREAIERAGLADRSLVVERASDVRERWNGLRKVDWEVPYMSLLLVGSPPPGTRRPADRGSVTVVGLGPGGPEWLTPEARAALAGADVVVGYSTYLARVPGRRGQRRLESDNGVELDRAREALDLAAAGERVAVVSSGDPGIFAMAAAVFEVAEEGAHDSIDVLVLAGLSAMQAVAARVGAPLGHDFCVISLSDRLKPAGVIERRLEAAGAGDLVVALYNPASRTRRAVLGRAREILLGHRGAQTPVVVARAVGSADEQVTVTTLGEVDLEAVDMRTLVIVGSSQTRVVRRGDRAPQVYTPRHYPAVGVGGRWRRPALPAGFDSSRAAERAADPHGWRYPAAAREAVHRVIAERRDIRRFRPDEVPGDVLDRVLEAAHRAPSVGLMQPWRLIVVSGIETRIAVRALAARERLRQADRFDERARAFLDQKIEGVVEAPLGICVCCDHGDPGVEVLGRGTIPETDVYSTACAIENLWLAARAEGLGVGWVSFYRPADLRAVLGIPDRVDPIAYLCVGWPDERPSRPGLEAAGWSSRTPVADVVMRERWREDLPPAGAARAGAGGPDRLGAIRARDRLDRLVKPAGSLGVLEWVIERWAQITGQAPPAELRAGILVCAGDHGHVGRGTSLFAGSVSAEVAAAAGRGETAIGVLARRGGHELVVADVGLVGVTPAGVRDAKVASGSADMTAGAALSPEQLDRALAAGAGLARELAGRGVGCLVLGEIGIGNTATAAALVGGLTGARVEVTVGRGTGLDAAGLERKRAVVAAAVARHGSGLGPREALLAFGGLELAALVGAAREAAVLRLPVVLDGFAVATAGLLARSLDPAVGEVLLAGHRSAEPGHDLVLAELGLEPLLDLRLRLGEASGAALALSLIEAAGALHREMATFEEAGVERASSG
jgi:nicotinate-nucleotide--dimethylbenzimidazole phosphoribosyltransferase